MNNSKANKIKKIKPVANSKLEKTTVISKVLAPSNENSDKQNKTNETNNNESITKAQILKVLESIEDPELGINIVDLGLIYEVRPLPKEKGKLQKVFIKMTFTSPACPLMNQILEEVKIKLDEFKDADIEIHVTFEPLWSTDRMSERAKIKLGLI